MNTYSRDRIRGLLRNTGLAAITIIAITGVRLLHAQGGPFAYSQYEQRPLTGFFALADNGTGLTSITFNWDDDTTGQWKRVVRSASWGSSSIMYTEGNDFSSTTFWEPDFETWGSTECYLEDPNWGYNYYHSWGLVTNL